MVNQEFLSSSKKWDWETPPDLWRQLNRIFNFVLDAAATAKNTKCEIFITPEMDALSMDWVVRKGEYWWLNPPWGKEYKKATGRTINLWMHHALLQYRKGYEGVAIVSARVDTRWFHNFCAPAPHYLFPLGRVKFIDPDTKKVGTQPTFPSVLVIFAELSGEQKRKLSWLGLLLEKTYISPNEKDLNRTMKEFKGYGVSM